MDFAGKFVETLHDECNEANSNLKLKIQRAIFPEGIYYNIPGFVETPLHLVYGNMKGYVLYRRNTIGETVVFPN